MDGINDLSNGVTQSQYQTALNTVLTSYRSALTGVPIVVEHIMKTGGGSDSSLPAWNGYIDATVAALSDALTVARGGAGRNYDPTTGSNTGGVHPDDAGSAQVAAQVAPEVQAMLPPAGTTTYVVSKTINNYLFDSPEP
jgi:lysophospholipase L1-like esterase